MKTWTFVVALLAAHSARAQSLTLDMSDATCPSRLEVEEAVVKLRPGASFAERDGRVHASVADLGDRYRVTMDSEKVINDPARRCTERARSVALVLALALDALGPATVPAPPRTLENTKAACTDRLDNDGDGHIDCDDQDCSDLAVCVPAAPQVALPSRVSLKPDFPEQHARGVGRITSGGIMLGLGASLALGSIGTWKEWRTLHDDNTGCSGCNSTKIALGFSIAMDALGAGLLVAGSAFTVSGNGQRAAAAKVYAEPAQQPPLRARRRRAIGELTAGSVLLGLAPMFAGGSAPLWAGYVDGYHTGGSTAALSGAITLDVLAVAMLATGSVLVSRGASAKSATQHAFTP